MWLINFRFTFGLPEHINDGYLPLYGGKVWIRGSNGDDLSIPYGGAFSPKKKIWHVVINILMRLCA